MIHLISGHFIEYKFIANKNLRQIGSGKHAEVFRIEIFGCTIYVKILPAKHTVGRQLDGEIVMLIGKVIKELFGVVDGSVTYNVSYLGLLGAV